jgi:ubiquinone biosynthesis protein
MERVMGKKVTDRGLASADDRRRLADLIIDALIARPIFAPDHQAIFHSDPHAGNLFLTTDHRLAILDWSLVGSLGERERVAMVQIILAALMLRPEKIVCTLVGLAERRTIDRPALETVVTAHLAKIRSGQFPGFTWLMELLTEAMDKAQLRVAADLMLFRKTLHTLEGVLADVGADGRRVADVLVGKFVCHLVTEWPCRWFALPDSRAFATRLSNADLGQFVLSIPGTVMRLLLEPSFLQSATPTAHGGGSA